MRGRKETFFIYLNVGNWVSWECPPSLPASESSHSRGWAWVTQPRYLCPCEMQDTPDQKCQSIENHHYPLELHGPCQFQHLVPWIFLCKFPGPLLFQDTERKMLQISVPENEDFCIVF